MTRHVLAARGGCVMLYKNMQRDASTEIDIS